MGCRAVGCFGLGRPDRHAIAVDFSYGAWLLRINPDAREEPISAQWGEALWGDALWGESRAAEIVLRVNSFDLSMEDGAMI